MERTPTESISQLPLSWARTNTTDPVLNLVKLPYSSPSWLPTAEIPHHYSFDQVYREYLSTLPNGFVLQSCGLSLRDYLLQQGCQVTPMGAEAVLDLPWRGKRSVRELTRRGRRHGSVHEIEYTSKNRAKLIQLLHESPARQGVQLKHTERIAWDESTRCFVFETAEGKWMGAITLSILAPNYVHTELLLRHPQAPVGIMEALITGIAEQLDRESVQFLSLGAVTPIPAEESDKILAAHRHPQELWTRSQIAFRLGRALKFAHNAEGLWRFKNKFAPRWEPLYLCASPGLSWATILGVIHATGYPNLVWSRLLESWHISIPRINAPTLLPDTLSRIALRRFACAKSLLPRHAWMSRGVPVKECSVEIRRLA